MHKVFSTTPLNDLIEIAIQTKYPNTVVEDGKLLGIIWRVPILFGLVLGKGIEKGEVVSPRITVIFR